MKPLTKLMKLKEKEGQKVDASVSLRRKNKMFMRENNGKNGGSGIAEKIIQKLPHMGKCSLCTK